MDWTLADFVIGVALLLAIGVATRFIVRNVPANRPRVMALGGLLVVVLLLWAELAVGVLGTPFAGS